MSTTYRVTKPGITLQTVRGMQYIGGKQTPITFSKVARVGEEFSNLPDHIVEAIESGRLKGIEKVTGSSSSSTSPPAGDTRSSVSGGAYDPSDYNQDEVLEYLASADPEEVERVKAIEASGKGRHKIAEFESEGSD